MRDTSAPTEKRVVVIHSCGLWQILGTSPPPYPSFFQFSSRNGLITRPASLLQVHPRYVLYREIVEPPSGHFNDFHPQQT